MKIIERPTIKQRADGPWLLMPCPKKSWCEVPVTLGEAYTDPIRGLVWGWNGNVERPTITPSIGCDIAPRCGQHRVITNGVISP